MKTLHPNANLRLCLGMSGMGIGIILWGMMWEDGEGLIFPGIIIVLMFLFLGRNVYTRHWIKYGNGKIIIHRVSKDMEYSGSMYGRPTGKWKNREDEFLLEELDSYGYSWVLFGKGKTVEFHPAQRGGSRSISREYSFLLKDGKKVGFEAAYYTTKQLEELFHYIYDETGIEVISFKSL